MIDCSCWLLNRHDGIHCGRGRRPSIDLGTGRHGASFFLRLSFQAIFTRDDTIEQSAVLHKDQIKLSTDLAAVRCRRGGRGCRADLVRRKSETAEAAAAAFARLAAAADVEALDPEDERGLDFSSSRWSSRTSGRDWAR